ncbi:MAG: helix-turn-helix domain-containing protein [Deltaproteobacteria bacterium]|nr:helix-turn-helix domain-containing protein [Deltaproteobacteria bacterium]
MASKTITNSPAPDRFAMLTGEIKQADDFSIEEIGDRIRRIRESEGLSYEQLSNMTGFDVELLEKIEKNEVKPQLGTIVRLSKALHSAFSRVLSGVGSHVYSITRKTERKAAHRSTSTKGASLYSYRSLAPEVHGRHMEALVVRLEENPDREMSVHDGEEFIYVLEGEVLLIIDKDEFLLEPGDSVYYLSTTPHMVAAKKGTADILAVLYEG